MKISHTLITVALLATLGGCDQLQTSLNKNTGDTGAAAPAATAMPAGKVVATVNGTPITEDVLNVYKKQRLAKGGDHEASKEEMVNELVALEIMRQQAVKEGLSKDPTVVATLDQLQRSTLAGAAIQAFLTSHPISDEQAKQAYDTKIGVPGKEYKARHILLASEDEAKKVIKELEGGADFAKLAKEKSTGPSGPSGGELGWFSSSQMVPEFSAAAAALEKGTYTKEPVKTQFGWHVIELEDVRDSTPPPYDDVKDRIKMVLANQELQAHMIELREAAKVDIKK